MRLPPCGIFYWDKGWRLEPVENLNRQFTKVARSPEPPDYHRVVRTSRRWTPDHITRGTGRDVEIQGADRYRLPLTYDIHRQPRPLQHHSGVQPSNDTRHRSSPVRQGQTSSRCTGPGAGSRTNALTLPPRGRYGYQGCPHTGG